jgi:hypothetical protein
MIAEDPGGSGCRYAGAASTRIYPIGNRGKKQLSKRDQPEIKTEQQYFSLPLLDRWIAPRQYDCSDGGYHNYGYTCNGGRHSYQSFCSVDEPGKIRVVDA